MWFCDLRRANSLLSAVLDRQGIGVCEDQFCNGPVELCCHVGTPGKKINAHFHHLSFNFF